MARKITASVGISPRQAVLWLADNQAPVSLTDENAINNWPDVSADKYRAARIQLLLVLRKEVIKAYGVLHIKNDEPGKNNLTLSQHSWEWESFLGPYQTNQNRKAHWKHLGRIIIPPGLWIERLLDWEKSILSYGTAVTIGGIVLDFASLTECLDPSGIQPEFGARKESKSGRPEKYQWDEFWVEIAVRADLDNLPNTQAEPTIYSSRYLAREAQHRSWS